MYYVIYVKFMLKDIENLAKIHEKKCVFMLKDIEKSMYFYLKKMLDVYDAHMLLLNKICG